jgi:energy-coupling factor transporter transmembrane protein EcfT
VLGFTISLGALNQAALFLGIMLISLIGSTILIWTTPISAIPPLLQRLTAWGRHVRLPLARLSAAIALGLRLAPMLLDDSRTILHLLGQRRRSKSGDRESWRQRMSLFTHGAFIACAATVRRAAETGDALTARGGIGTIAGPDQRPGVRDLLAVLFAAGILAIGALL